jgi:hypothetical protein
MSGLWENLSRVIAISIYVMGLGTDYDVTSDGDYFPHQGGPSDHSIHTDDTTPYNRRQ